MSKIIITDSNMFEKIIDELENIIPDFESVFANQNKNFNMIDGTDTYRGECQEVLSQKYNDFKKNYDSIDETLINYVKYLKITLENYRNYEREINKSIDLNENGLNINQ